MLCKVGDNWLGCGVQQVLITSAKSTKMWVITSGAPQGHLRRQNS